MDTKRIPKNGDVRASVMLGGIVEQLSPARKQADANPGELSQRQAPPLETS